MARRRERPGKDAPQEAVIERNHSIDWSTVFHAGANGDAVAGDETTSSAPTQAGGPEQPRNGPVSSPAGEGHDWSSVLRSDLAGSPQAQPADNVQSTPTPVPPTPSSDQTGQSGSEVSDSERPSSSSWMSNMRSMLAPTDPDAEKFFEDSLELQAPTPIRQEGRPSIFEEVVSAPRDSDSVFTSAESDLELFGSPETASDATDIGGAPTALDPDAVIEPDGAGVAATVAEAGYVEDIEDLSLGPTGIFGGPSGWFDALLDTEATNDLDRRSRALAAQEGAVEEPARSFLDIVGSGPHVAESEAALTLREAGTDADGTVADGTDADGTDEEESDLGAPEETLEESPDRYGRLELRSPADDIELLLITTEPIGSFASPSVRCEVNLCPPGTQLDVLKLHYDTTVWSADDADVVWDYVSGWLPKIWVTVAGKRRITGTVIETWVAYKDDMMPGEQHLRTTATLDDALDFESFSRIQRDAIEDRTGGRWFDAVEVQPNP